MFGDYTSTTFPKGQLVKHPLFLLSAPAPVAIKDEEIQLSIQLPTDLDTHSVSFQCLRLELIEV